MQTIMLPQAWTLADVQPRMEALLPRRCAGPTEGATGQREHHQFAAGFKQLMRTKLGPLNVLRWMSEPHSQYGDVLVAKGHCPTAWLGATTGFLRKLKDIDIIRLRHVRKDAAAAIYLDAHFRNARVDELAPWLDLKAFADEAAYDARYSSSQRKRRKKIRKSLEDEFGPVTFEVLTEVPLATAAVRDAITEKCQWIDERGRQNRVLCCPNLPAFLESLLRTRQGTAQLVVSRLCAGGRPISWELGIRYGAVHFCFITSHVNALTNFSPARLHMDFSQRQAIKDGMARFDLMVPNDAYKDSWCSARMATQDYHLPLSPAGRAYGSIYLETLRPHMREAYYRMPPNLLRLLKPILGH